MTTAVVAQASRALAQPIRMVQCCELESARSTATASARREWGTRMWSWYRPASTLQPIPAYASAVENAAVRPTASSEE